MRIEAETLRDLEDSVEPIAAEPEQKGSARAGAETGAAPLSRHLARLA